ncbi:Beta-1,3-galactosyltransferase 1 [Aphelenchoides avenae]|nr:Beta-1,3-galactosyltransferase 1 [Aphelenchus avenae]
MVEEENILHGDILQQDFIDDYKNLTLKSAMWLRYMGEFAQNKERPKHIVKVDDDVVVDVFELAKLLRNPLRSKADDNEEAEEPNGILCSVSKGMPIQRDPESRWYIPERDLPSKTDVFPPYCSGAAFVMQLEQLRLLWQRLRKSDLPYITVDDFFITGYLATKAGIRLINKSKLYSFDAEDPLKDIRERGPLFTVLHDEKLVLFERAWKEVLARSLSKLRHM